MLVPPGEHPGTGIRSVTYYGRFCRTALDGLPQCPSAGIMNGPLARSNMEDAGPVARPALWT